jgi:hypothetical protein
MDTSFTDPATKEPRMITTLAGSAGHTFHVLNRAGTAALCRSNLTPRTFPKYDADGKVTEHTTALYRMPGDSFTRSCNQQRANCLACQNKLAKEIDAAWTLAADVVTIVADIASRPLDVTKIRSTRLVRTVLAAAGAGLIAMDMSGTCWILTRQAALQEAAAEADDLAAIRADDAVLDVLGGRTPGAPVGTVERMALAFREDIDNDPAGPVELDPAAALEAARALVLAAKPRYVVEESTAPLCDGGGTQYLVVDTTVPEDSPQGRLVYVGRASGACLTRIRARADEWARDLNAGTLVAWGSIVSAPESAKTVTEHVTLPGAPAVDIELGRMWQNPGSTWNAIDTAGRLVAEHVTEQEAMRALRRGAGPGEPLPLDDADIDPETYSRRPSRGASSARVDTLTKASARTAEGVRATRDAKLRELAELQARNENDRRNQEQESTPCGGNAHVVSRGDDGVAVCTPCHWTGIARARVEHAQAEANLHNAEAGYRVTGPYTRDQFEGIGGDFWAHLMKGHERVYLNDWEPMAGLEINRYKSGNICSALLDGELISNTRAGLLTTAQVYLDVKTGSIVSTVARTADDARLRNINGAMMEQRMLLAIARAVVEFEDTRPKL